MGEWLYTDVALMWLSRVDFMGLVPEVASHPITRTSSLISNISTATLPETDCHVLTPNDIWRNALEIDIRVMRSS